MGPLEQMRPSVGPIYRIIRDSSLERPLSRPFKQCSRDFFPNSDSVLGAPTYIASCYLLPALGSKNSRRLVRNLGLHGPFAKNWVPLQNDGAR